MTEKKGRVEALLFSSARWMSEDELSRLTRFHHDTIKQILKDLKEEYDKRESAVTMLHDRGKWKLTTKDQYFGDIKKIVGQTELTKTILETLSVIAFKYPIKQSDLIKIRTNKAYDHIKKFRQLGLVNAKRMGHTLELELSDEFYEYFNVHDKGKETKEE